MSTWINFGDIKTALYGKEISISKLLEQYKLPF